MSYKQELATIAVMLIQVYAATRTISFFDDLLMICPVSFKYVDISLRVRQESRRVASTTAMISQFRFRPLLGSKYAALTSPRCRRVTTRQWSLSAPCLSISASRHICQQQARCARRRCRHAYLPGRRHEPLHAHAPPRARLALHFTGQRACRPLFSANAAAPRLQTQGMMVDYYRDTATPAARQRRTKPHFCPSGCHMTHDRWRWCRSRPVHAISANALSYFLFSICSAAKCRFSPTGRHRGRSPTISSPFRKQGAPPRPIYRPASARRPGTPPARRLVASLTPAISASRQRAMLAFHIDYRRELALGRCAYRRPGRRRYRSAASPEPPPA